MSCSCPPPRRVWHAGLEAGLAGIPVMCASMPAANEIGKADVVSFDPDQSPQETAIALVQMLENNPLIRFRRRIRLNYTWQALFTQRISPLLKETP